MTRIRIEDLPAVENLTPEELENLLGAGGRSFRPTLEALEGREMYAANINATLVGGVLKVSTQETAAVSFRVVNNQVQVLNQASQVVYTAPGAVKAIDLNMQNNGPVNVDLTKLGKLGSDVHFQGGQGAADVLFMDPTGRLTDAHFRDTKLVSSHTEGTQQLQFANGYHGTLKMDANGKHTLEIFDAKGARVLYGVEQPDGKYKVLLSPPGKPPVEMVFDKFGGHWDETRNASAPDKDMKMESRNGNTLVNGKFSEDGQWVVTTWSGVDVTVTMTYKDFGTNGQDGKLTRETRTEGGVTKDITYNDDGSRQVDTTGGPDFSKRAELFNKDGQLVARLTYKTDGTVIDEVWDKGVYTKNVWKTEAGYLAGVQGSKDHISKTVGRWVDGKFVETITGPKDFIKQINIYDKADGPRTLLSSFTFGKDMSITQTVKDGKPTVLKIQEGGQIQQNGTVRVNTAEGGYKIYQLVGDRWQLVKYARPVDGMWWVFDGNKHVLQRGVRWVEESWGADGTYTQDVWMNKDHGDVGSADHVMRTVVKDGFAVTTYYHAKNIGYSAPPGLVGAINSIFYGDGLVEARYAVTETGAPKEMLQYYTRVRWGGIDYTNCWYRETGWNTKAPSARELYWRGIYGGDGTPSFTGPNVQQFLPTLKLDFTPKFFGDEPLPS